MPLSSPTVSPARLFTDVGGTPLLPIRRLARFSEKVRLFAKAEWLNPGGSVKDRPAARMIEAALNSKALTPGKTILDASSGNTGIALAWMGTQLGCPVKLCVPESINPQRRAALEAYGAELVLTDPLAGSDGAIREARRLHADDPGRFWYADQYSNPANWEAHYEGTALEILDQTGGKVTHFIAGLGTSGTFCGTARRLKQERPGLRAVSLQPDSPLHGLEGWKHLDSAIMPAIYDPSVADEKRRVSTELGQRTAVLAAKKEGILVSPSGGANLAAAILLADELSHSNREAVIVTVLPDSGERTLGERFWKESP